MKTISSLNKDSLFVFVVVVFLMNPSCTILDQVDEMNQFSRCEFKIKDVQQLNIAGVDMEGKHSFSDFSFIEMSRLTTALAGDKLPADFTVKLKARNPNSTKASMNKLDWKLLLDNRYMTEGTIDKYIEIPPDDGEADVPVKVSVDLKEILSGESGKALMNLVANITGQGSNSSNVSMKLSPSIRVGNRMLQYPGYITIEHQVGK